jgi:methanogenic corrinoid protein MtbC1
MTNWHEAKGSEDGAGGGAEAVGRGPDPSRRRSRRKADEAGQSSGQEKSARVGQLVSTLEGEVIPRLVLLRRARAYQSSGEVGWSPQSGGVECIDEFARLLLASDVEVAYSYIDAIRSRGVVMEAIYLELLAPTARRLGEMWEQDLCGFADVTVALCRLHEVLRGLSPVFRADADTAPLSRRILLAPVPGDQHTFGLLMVADFFRREGWDVWSEPVESRVDLIELVQRQWFSVVGLSVGGDTGLVSISAIIHELRKASRNRSVGIMVGGPLFIKEPELAVQVGADATAMDGRHATVQAEQVVSLLTGRW